MPDTRYGDERIKALREKYPEGTVVIATPEKSKMYPVPAGTKGKMTGVTDSGMISVKWEKHGSHVLLPEIDSFEVAGN